MTVTLRKIGATAAMATLALVPIACSGSSDSDDSSGAPATATVPTTPTFTASELEQALLTLTDMPPGWTLDSSPSSSTSPDSGEDVTDFLCATASTPLRTESHPEAEVEFTKSDETGPWFLQMISSAPDAADHYTDVDRVLGSCVGESWTVPTEGAPMSMSMSEVSGANVGDRATTYRLTGRATEDGVVVTMSVDYTLVQNGVVVQLYGSANLQAVGATIDTLPPEQFASLVAKGNDKVTDTLDTAATS